VSAVREVVLQAAPMFVDLIAPPAPPTPPTPVPAVPPAPLREKLPPRPNVIAAPRSAEPAPFIVPAAPPDPLLPALPVAAAAAVQAPSAPTPAPRLIPASAVQYLVPPQLVYPRLSERNGERGRVLVRVFIDTAGMPQEVQVGSSSGFARLDEAALAAVRHARFKPYTENGQPTAGWAVVPASFE
jgi:protein TonB